MNIKYLFNIILFVLCFNYGYTQIKHEYQYSKKFSYKPTFYHISKKILYPDNYIPYVEDVIYDKNISTIIVLESIPITTIHGSPYYLCHYLSLGQIQGFNDRTKKQHIIFTSDWTMLYNQFLFQNENYYAYSGLSRLDPDCYDKKDGRRFLRYGTYVKVDTNFKDSNEANYNFYGYGNAFDLDSSLFVHAALLLHDKIFTINTVSVSDPYIAYLWNYRYYFGYENFGKGYTRGDKSLNGKLAYEYFWGDTTDYKVWFIEEDWPNSTNQLAWHHDSLEFIEIWGMDTIIDPASTIHPTKQNILRKMTPNGKKIWAKTLPVKLHYTDTYREKSPFMDGGSSFCVIDNSNDIVGFKGPYYTKFTFYRFDTSGNLMHSKQLKFPYGICGRASWPIADACGNVYTIFHNLDNNGKNKYTLYRIDSLGNINWQASLPSHCDWFGAKHMVISDSMDIFLVSTSNDSIVYVKFSELSPTLTGYSGDTSLCTGGNIKFMAKGDRYTNSFQWYRDGQLLPNQRDSILEINNIQKANEGNYVCIAKNCVKFDTTVFINVSIPWDSSYHKAQICENDSFNFGNKWYKNSGIYAETYSGYQGCDSIEVLEVEKLPMPYPPFEHDTFFCVGKSIQLDALNEGASFLWNTGENTQMIHVESPGLYSLKIEKNGCHIYDTIMVFDSLCVTGFYIPNAFTPNSDNLNETFMPITSLDFTDYLFIVYNRWGQEVFRTIDQTKGWDGTFKNKECPEGVYLYVVNYKTNSESFKTESGNVTLLR